MNVSGRLFSLDQPVVMGILNITPDSFYDGGRHNSSLSMKQRIDDIMVQGADMIDVGAYSSRPGALHISEKEEWERLMPALEMIRRMYPDAVVSVDTFRSAIARRSVNEYEVAIINDISGGSMDREMAETIGGLGVPYVLMHMLGTPQNMQHHPVYENDVVDEINLYFSKKINWLTRHGVKDIILDPGFGFGKTLEHNYSILNRLDEFQIHEMPILVGVSRKSLIYNALGVTADESLNGTTVLNTLALQRGAGILRVHDVKEAKECIKLVALMNSGIK